MVGMLVGLGRLQNLHALRGFMLQSSRAEGWCTIEELRSLSCLTDLSIEKLECISSGSEARAVQLRNKTKLRFLELNCTYGLQPNEEEMRRIEEVFEELHPPPSPEELQIKNYFGREFPKGMTETSSSASILFPNWRVLLIKGWRYCEQLPNLDRLNIYNFAASVIDVGPEFSVGASSTSSGGGRAGVNTSKYAFPSLKNLDFNDMDNWQEWRWNTSNAMSKGPDAFELPQIDVSSRGSPAPRNLPDNIDDLGCRQPNNNRGPPCAQRTAYNECLQTAEGFKPPYAHNPRGCGLPEIASGGESSILEKNETGRL
ncbi:hypothetical protein COCNU_contig69583083G000010 [Cocos nucifera]|nr:hypothetical protein [Cocos nucifera]